MIKISLESCDLALDMHMMIGEHVLNKKSKLSLLRRLELKGALPTDQEIAKKAKTISSWTHLPFHNFTSQLFQKSLD